MPGTILDNSNAAAHKTNDFHGAYILVGMILYLNSYCIFISEM